MIFFFMNFLLFLNFFFLLFIFLYFILYKKNFSFFLYFYIFIFFSFFLYIFFEPFKTSILAIFSCFNYISYYFYKIEVIVNSFKKNLYIELTIFLLNKFYYIIIILSIIYIHSPILVIKYQGFKYFLNFLEVTIVFILFLFFYKSIINFFIKIFFLEAFSFFFLFFFISELYDTVFIFKIENIIYTNIVIIDYILFFLYRYHITIFLFLYTKLKNAKINLFSPRFFFFLFLLIFLEVGYIYIYTMYIYILCVYNYNLKWQHLINIFFKKKTIITNKKIIKHSSFYYLNGKLEFFKKKYQSLKIIIDILGNYEKDSPKTFTAETHTEKGIVVKHQYLEKDSLNIIAALTKNTLSKKIDVIKANKETGLLLVEKKTIIKKVDLSIPGISEDINLPGYSKFSFVNFLKSLIEKEQEKKKIFIFKQIEEEKTKLLETTLERENIDINELILYVKKSDEFLANNNMSYEDLFFLIKAISYTEDFEKITNYF